MDEKTKARFKGFEDDCPEKCGVKNFTGKVLHFDPEGEYKDWESMVEYLMGK